MYTYGQCVGDVAIIFIKMIEKIITQVCLANGYPIETGYHLGYRNACEDIIEIIKKGTNSDLSLEQEDT